MFWSEILRTNEKNLKFKKIIKYKLRRAIYSEIMNFNKYSNYVSAKMLGYILNIFELKAKRDTYYKEWYWFHKLILNWTKKNYLRILTENKDMAKACLIGDIEYDRKKKRLVDKKRNQKLKV